MLRCGVGSSRGGIAAILFPVFAKAREKARQTSCLSNSKQLGTAFMMYVQDYDEMAPYTYFENGTSIWSVLCPYIKNWDIFTCPSGKGRALYYIYTPGAPQGDYVWLPVSYSTDEIHYPYRSVYTAGFKSMGEVARPAERGWCWESSGLESVMNRVYCPLCLVNWSIPQYLQCVSRWHNDGSNVSFLDGHAKWMSFSALTATDTNSQVLYGHINQ